MKKGKKRTYWNRMKVLKMKLVIEAILIDKNTTDNGIDAIINDGMIMVKRWRIGNYKIPKIQTKQPKK